MSFQSTYDRIKQATGLHTQTEIADFLGIRQSSISDAKRRDAIPAVWLITLFDKMALNPSWLRSGEGQQYLTGTDGQPQASPLSEQQLVSRLEPILRAALLCTAPDLADKIRQKMNDNLNTHPAEPE